MLGNSEEQGIMPLAVSELLRRIEQTASNYYYNFKLSYLEIYNETIKDLLMPLRSANLDLREDPSRGIIVAGLSQMMITKIDEIMTLLHHGNKNRTQEATYMNQTSSRSHAVLQLTVERKEKERGMTSEVDTAILTLIDLAGSERARETKNRGIRLIEGANINKSLLALGNVVNALSEKTRTGKNIFIPYRDSKLTRLLKVNIHVHIYIYRIHLEVTAGHP